MKPEAEPARPAPATPRKIRCPGCGSANYLSDPVCLSCGRHQERAARTAALQPPERPAGLRRGRPASVPGTLILILGGLSLVLGHYWIFGLCLGPVAWVLGNRAQAAMGPGEGPPLERGQVQAGRICGMISSAFLALFLLVAAPILGLGLWLRGSGAPTVPTNAPAPEVRLTDLGGREQTLGAYRGRILLLNFFASW